MPLIRKTIRRQRQPSPAVRVDEKNPLVVSGGLKGVWAGCNEGRDALGSINGVLANGASVGISENGPVFNLDGVDDLVVFGTVRSLEVYTGRLVVFARIMRTAGLVNFSGVINSGKTNTNAGGWMLVGIASNSIRFFIDTTGVGGWLSVDTAAININQWYDICGTWDGANIRVYLNGELQQTAACASIAYPAVLAVSANIGRYNNNWPGSIALAGFGEGFWTDTEVKRFAVNPWQIFTPHQRQMWLYTPMSYSLTANIESQAATSIQALFHVESPTLTSATATANAEALTPTTATATANAEALATLSTGVTLLAEALQYVRYDGALSIEVLTTINVSQLAHVESLQFVAGTATLSIDMLQAIALAINIPIEALQIAGVNVIMDMVNRTAWFNVTLSKHVNF